MVRAYNCNESLVNAIVDEDFYLSKYPDVKSSKIGATEHYLKHGRYEGRLPCQLRTLAYEADLWADHSNSALEMIRNLAESSSETSVEGVYANWTLARYYHFIRNGDLAVEHLRRLWQSPIRDILFPHDGPLCLVYELSSFYNINAFSGIKSANVFQSGVNGCIARIIDVGSDANAKWSELLNISLPQSTHIETVDSLASIKSIRSIAEGPKVSILMPAYNAETTLKTALLSLANQTWKNIEVIVVDDASTDKTVEVFTDTVGSDPRFVLKSLTENRGAYYARNAGLAIASGAFITVMDADDWAHPEKIELQVKAISNKPLKKASVSYLARSTNNLKFTHWRIETSWVQPNISSLMVKRNVVKKIGYWDEVKAGADSEYFNRLLTRFGSKAVVYIEPDRPLSICRVSEGSLTGNSETGIATFLKGARADYFTSFTRWHRNASKRELFVPIHATYRNFSAPLALFKQSAKAFDAQWYQDAYGDVAKARIRSLEHFERYGRAEGREPSPHAVAAAFPLVKSDEFDNIGSKLLPIFRGVKKYNQGLPTYMFFGHMFGESVYGAERSLVDLLTTQKEQQINSVVVLPAGCNIDYLKQLLALSCYVHLIPMPHWRADRGLNTAVRSNLENVIKSYRTAFCYINTLTLWEPVVAAQACAVPATMHVREIPENDKELCRYLHATTGSIAKHLVSLRCPLWANSKKTFDWLLTSGVSKKKLELLYNGIDVEKFAQLADVSPHNDEIDNKLTVGMLSNNSPKKGIRDFYRIQKGLNNERVRFKLFGAETKHVKLANKSNYEYMGYVNDPADGLAQCDVILCLSHVKESFGRTALEAMAAGRIVIAYDWGALGEVVGDAGILVGKGDIKAVSRALMELSTDADLVSSYSVKASERARDFSLEKLGDNFVRLSDKLIKSKAESKL